MPRYHFNAIDGSCREDVLGIELPDEQAARRQAVEYAGDVLRSHPDALLGDGSWRVDVTDGKRLLFSVAVSLVPARR